VNAKVLTTLGAMVVAALAVLAATPKVAHASTPLSVTSFTDSTSVEPCVAGVCATLRDAVAQANTDGNGDVISLATGSYSLTNCDLGSLDVTTSMSIVGAGSGQTTISGGTCAPSTPWDLSLITVTGCTSLSVTGVTLTDGDAAAATSSGSGGAISDLGCDPTGSPALTLHDVDVVGNTAAVHGGGIAVEGSTAVSLTDVTLAHNTAGAQGGGLWAQVGGAGVSVSLSDVYAHDNDAAGCVTPVTSDEKSDAPATCVAANSQGGGMWISLSTGSAAPDVTASNLLISKNIATNGDGGGVFLGGEGVASFSAVTLAGNQATGTPDDVVGVGGGVFVDGNSHAGFTNTTATGNTASASGGAFGLAGESAANLALLNATINGNTAGTHNGGGAIANGTGNATAVTIAQSILNGNTANAALDECSSALTSGSNSWNLADDDTCELDGAHDDNTTASAGLSSLAANAWSGGPPNVGAAADSAALPTEALDAGSPAIDAIAGGCPAPATDERGVTRAQNATHRSTANCDIGAFEALPTAAAPPQSSVLGVSTPNVPTTGAGASSGAGYLLVILGGAAVVGGGVNVRRARRRR
jgi:hypothetical protein